MSAEVELISTMGEKKSWNRPPIQMEFQVFFTVYSHTFWKILCDLYLISSIICKLELKMRSSEGLEYIFFVYELSLGLHEKLNCSV